MKLKERTTGSPAELAKFLLDISKHIVERKSVSVRGTEINLPPLLDIKLKYKEKEGRAKIKLSIVWDKDARQNELKAVAGSVIEGQKHQGLKIVETAGQPRKLKELKKEMEKVLFTIKKALRDNRLPAPADVENFNNLILVFKQKAKSKWLPSIAELETTAADMTQAITDQNQSVALAEIAKIMDLKEKYHDIFK